VTQDPLESLILDATEADRATIAGVLSGRIGIDRATGRIVLLPGYSPLNARSKVLLVLFASKAAHLLGLRESEFVRTQEVVTVSGLPPGTVAPTLKGLREERVVAQGADRAYYVPNALLHRVAEQLRQEA